MKERQRKRTRRDRGQGGEEIEDKKKERQRTRRRKDRGQKDVEIEAKSKKEVI